MASRFGRLKWNGDVHLLFNCLDTDGARAGGRRNISHQEIFFLDSWEVKEEEMRAHEETKIDHKKGEKGDSPTSPQREEILQLIPSKSEKYVGMPLMPPPKVDPYPLPPLKVSKSTPTLTEKQSRPKPKAKPPCKFLQRLLKESGAEGLLR
ncbi:unnamed protein product [Durusdinium trenchii]|uniref:Uncharacterized protein n=1 Tax=Durusdinium trenchii TaxID=1381693 RepID=A0ABP0NBS7_9DINO